MGDGGKLFQFGGDDHERHALAAEFFDHFQDFRMRADIDAAAFGCNHVVHGVKADAHDAALENLKSLLRTHTTFAHYTAPALRFLFQVRSEFVGRAGQNFQPAAGKHLLLLGQRQ